MLKLNKYKKLPEGYNYYSDVMEKTKKIAKDIFREDYNEILEQKLYNLIISLCNQVIYDYSYTFTKDDLFLLADYDINIHKVLKKFEDDIMKMRLSLK